MASRVFLFAFGSITLCFASWATSRTVGGERLLVAEGKSDYVIVLPPSPAPAVLTAANELRDHVLAMANVSLPIVSETDVAPDTPHIFVGPTRRLAELAPDLKLNELGHDAVVMKTSGRDLFLAGRPPRGTLYSVYTFLEDIVGCRWWTSEERYIPSKTDLEVPELDICYAPPMRYREAYYRDAFKGEFAARLKLNGHSNQIPQQYGGHYRFVGFVHTFFPLLPPSKYFDAHPEWYSEINGTRTAERSQLCLTNDQMRRELTKVALSRLQAQPDAGLISISQNDWHGQCQCEKCRAVEQEEGSPAGPLIRFVNRVAEEIEKQFPDVLVETLAYQYTRKPPRLVRPRKNVVIRLCSIECSFVQPLAAGPHNDAFRRDIEGWSKIAPQLFVWDYVTNFSSYLVPHPNMRVLAPNIRYFVDNRVIGLFEQGDSQSTIGDFIRLRAWLLAHLMWDPTKDQAALVEEFLCGYYGDAAPYLSKYLDVVHDAGQRSGVYLRCFMSDTSKYLTLDDLNQATRLFAKAAQAVAGDPVLSRRVRRERMPLDHVWLRRYYALRMAARVQAKDFLGPEDPVAACEEFIRLAHEFKVGNYRERHAFAEYEPALRSRFRPEGPAPRACRDLPADDWVDFQDNQFRLARPGTWTSTVNDAKASDGKATRMPGEHHEWATSLPLSNDLAVRNPWRCFVVVRAEVRGADGPAMTMGIYDPNTRKSVANRVVSISEIADGDYQVFDLGSFNIDGGMYVWVAPPKRPGEVKAVYVDRIYLVRDKE